MPIVGAVSMAAIMLAAGLALLTSAESAVACVDADSGSIPLYETFEAVIANRGRYKNSFDYEEIALEGEFQTPDGRKVTISGFYDGFSEKNPGPVWRLRAVADRPGVWRYRYRWSDDTSGGEGCFIVDGEAKPGLHGHAHVDSDHPSYLVHDDGTPHYWWGGKWISASNYGPAEKGGEVNDSALSDAVLIRYLDRLRQFDHNGLLIKVALYPLQNDKISWDLSWIRRAEWLVKEAGRRRGTGSDRDVSGSAPRQSACPSARSRWSSATIEPRSGGPGLIEIRGSFL